MGIGLRKRLHEIHCGMRNGSTCPQLHQLSLGIKLTVRAEGFTSNNCKATGRLSEWCHGGLYKIAIENFAMTKQGSVEMLPSSHIKVQCELIM